MIEVIIDQIKYKLGKNAKENFQLIDEALEIDSDFWWFHLNDTPSGHCIIFSKELDKSMIINASNMVKEHSKEKNKRKVKIIYCQVKNIKKTKTMGEVIVNIQNKFSFLL